MFIKIFGEDFQPKSNKTIGKTFINTGIINIATSQLNQDRFRIKINIIGLVAGIWFGNHNWKVYKILLGEYPTFE